MEQVGIQLVIRRGDATGKFGMVISNGKHKTLKVSLVRKNMAAEAAGVLKNDTILSMDGAPTSQIWKQAIDMFRTNQHPEVSIQVIPKAKVTQASLEPIEDLIAMRSGKGKSWGIEIAQGPGGKAIVTVCKKGSPMDKAGVTPGDMVIGISGNITSPQFFEVQGLIGDSVLEITMRVSRRFHWTDELYGVPKRRFSRTSVENDFFDVASGDGDSDEDGSVTTAAGYMEVPENAAVSSAVGYMEVPEFMGGGMRPGPDPAVSADPVDDGGLLRETADHELAAAIGKVDLDSDAEDEEL